MKKLFVQITQKIDKRNSVLLRNIIYSFIIKGGSLIVSLLTIPVYMRFFRNDSLLGLWFTAISMLNWIITFDLGIGDGLRNELVAPLERKDYKTCREMVSSAYITFGTILVVVSIVLFLTIRQINWNIVFNIEPSLVPQKVLLKMVSILLASTIARFFLMLLYSIFYAMQKSAIPDLISFITNSMLLIFAYTLPIGTVESNLTLLSIAHFISSVIPLLVVSFYIYGYKHKEIAPSIGKFNKRYVKQITGLGSKFLIIQIVTMLIFSTREFFITWVDSSKAVVEFQIYFKIGNIVASLFVLIFTPVWSAVTQAHVKGDYKWIGILYKRAKILLLLASVFQIALSFLLQIIVNIWLGENAIQINFVYALIIAGINIIFMWMIAHSKIVSGIGYLKPTIVSIFIGAILNVGLIILLSQYYDSWIIVMVANIISLIPYSIYVPLTLSKKIRDEKRTSSTM